MAVRGQDSLQLFEFGKLYFDRGDFKIAIEKLQTAAAEFLLESQFDQYLACQNLLLRMHAERDENDCIMRIKENLQDLVLREGFQLTSRTYYTLGVSASYRLQRTLALEYFQKALDLGLKTDNKEDVCHAIIGIAVCYKDEGRYTDALKEIYNLRVFFEVIDLPLLRVSAHILNGNILRELGRHEEALEIYRSCYDLLKTEKNQMFYLKTLSHMGVAYKDLGDTNLAKVYLQLSSSSVDRENMVHLGKFIDKHLADLGISAQNDYDLIFSPSSHTVNVRKKGKIEFKNQFILLDLLHLFVKNPGTVFSKEELVRTIWKQEYNPAVHDNKIYVTIKRLRKIVEPDYEKPRYVFRGKNGYYLSKSTRVLLEQ